MSENLREREREKKNRPGKIKNFYNKKNFKSTNLEKQSYDLVKLFAIVGISL